MTERVLFMSDRELEGVWRCIALSAGALGASGRVRSRIADLAIARSAAESLGLVPLVFRRSGSSTSALQRAMGAVASFELPPLGQDRLAWQELQEMAVLAGERVAESRVLHEWSSASQGSDSGRKSKGAYGTPPELAAEMVGATLSPVLGKGGTPSVCDPSAGHGALLIAAFDHLVEAGYGPAEASVALHGVELDPHAWELCCLLVWLAGAGAAGVELGSIRQRIVLGNALRGRFAHGHDAASCQPSLFASPIDLDTSLVWDDQFQAVFVNGGFDVVVMNPPWESLRHRLSDDAEHWVEREATRRRLSTAVGSVRDDLPPLYSSQGRGDRNLYKGFVELVPHLLRQGGRVGALLPGAFASDLGMQPARELYLAHMAIEQWTSFENLEKYFPIDTRYKFGILIAKRTAQGTKRMQVRFLARHASEIRNAPHVRMSRDELAQLGGQARMFPEISNELELAVLTRAFEAGVRFFDPVGPFGRIKYQRELDLTLDRKSGRFKHVERCRRLGYKSHEDGSWGLGDDSLVPLIEGRMIAAFDFFQKSWRGGSGRTARWTHNEDLPLAACQPQFLAERVQAGIARLAICDVTSATNTRTMLAAWLPPWPCGNTAPVLVLDEVKSSLALLAVLNSMTFDWILRRIVAGLHLNRFYLEATPLPRLGESEVRRLADFAAAATNACPRVASLDRSDRAGLPDTSLDDDAPAAAAVEAAVARGYGLTPEQFSYVLSGDARDRKGLWRYYAAAPGAARIAEESLRLLEAA